MATTFSYTTVDGDSIDLLVSNYYGTTDGRVVEKVLDANPGLSARGPVLPAGVKIQLPEIEEPRKTTGLRLWG